MIHFPQRGEIPGTQNRKWVSRCVIGGLFHNTGSGELGESVRSIAAQALRGNVDFAPLGGNGSPPSLNGSPIKGCRLVYVVSYSTGPVPGYPDASAGVLLVPWAYSGFGNVLRLFRKIGGLGLFGPLPAKRDRLRGVIVIKIELPV